MRKITLREFNIQNFKGIKSLKIGCNGDLTIRGANGTGKTTLFDFFTWMLFDKRSDGVKQFDIKTLDENNEPIHHLDHLGEMTLDVDGEKILLKKVLREKWTKRRGSEKTEFTGHETNYWFNDVPVSQAEYQKKIDEICNEQLFKTVTNVGHFFSLKTTEQRDLYGGA